MHVPESKRIMSLLIMLLTTSFIFAQVTVTGNVRDEKGDEVIGATVLLTGSQHGVITDVDGNFKFPMQKQPFYKSPMSAMRHKRLP